MGTRKLPAHSEIMCQQLLSYVDIIVERDIISIADCFG